MAPEMLLIIIAALILIPNAIVATVHEITDYLIRKAEMRAETELARLDTDH